LFLRQITLHGFKSFADRLNLTFEPGITAIVGPNGSGKSNLADAVRWVLGESRARELRGGRLEDVIFAGSARRRSLGLAEVTLTLDNRDGFLPVGFGELSVTRRLYRSGESEFLLNQTPCRLRDIHELFLDSGVGRNAYALLSQAEIDAVLSAQPEERRHLFEEAAGVAKFRAKRGEALRKLEETEQSLARVGDILGELSARVGPAREKARRAERHAELRAELRGVEVALLAGLLQEAERRVEEAGEELIRRQMAAAEILGALHQAEARVVQARLAVAQADTAREEAVRQVLALATELERVEGALRAVGERLVRWTEELGEAAAARETLAGKLEAAAARAEKEEQSSAAGAESLAGARAAVAAETAATAAAAAEVRRREEALDQKKSELIERLDEAARLRNELRGLEASRQAGERQRERLAKAAAEAQAAVAVAQRAMAEAEKQRQRAWEEVTRREHKRDEAVRVLAAEAEEQRRLEERQRAGEAELARLRSRHQVLRDWRRNREGYAEGPRAVLAAQESGRLTGVLGTVANLLRVPVGLERAIEAALGASLQDVVVEDEEAARRGIHFLKETGAGRATFLPLAFLAPRPLPARDRRELAAAGGGGFIGVGDELVEYPAPLRPAVEYLLGRVMIAGDLETAFRVGRASSLRYLVVTTGGEVVRPGGAVTGGREERSRGLLRRQREAAEVEEALSAAEERQARLEEEVEEARRRRAVRQEEQVVLDEAWRSQQERLAAADREVAVRTAEWRQSEAVAERAQGDLAALEGGFEGRPEEELTALLAQAEGVRRALEEAIARESAELREAVRQREEAGERLLAGRIALAGREKDLEATQAETARLRAEAEGLVRQAAAAGARVVALEERLREAEAEAARLEGERAERARQRAEAEERAAALAGERAALSEAVGAAEEEADRIRGRREEAQEAKQEAELLAARAELEAENLTARLLAEWGVERREALRLSATWPAERAAAANRAETLRRRLRALGVVDPEAVGEYRALAERHGFLSRQYDDLLAARASLTQVLTEVEATTAQRFRETFEAVREEFAALFRRVFGGGEATLRLTEPERPAESGIEVEGQPPGKKNRSLMALSNGERTLTALALLFALMRVRPAPFCVLDEVDAALDEANLDRFVSLLRDFAAGSQFIVITHRRLTMEAAEVLYGVTMEEPGASRLVSVRLAEAG
jgi:chromosome segregation protein